MENTIKLAHFCGMTKAKHILTLIPGAWNPFQVSFSLNPFYFIEIQQAPVQIQISEVIFMTEIVSGKPARSRENF